MMARARFMRCTSNKNLPDRDELGVAKASLLDGLKAGDTARIELMQLKSKKWEIVNIVRKQ